LKKKDQYPLLLKFIRWVFPKLEAYAPRLAHRYFEKIFFTPLHYPVPEKEQKAKTFARLSTVTAAGKTIQVYTWGEGQPVLLIHGWAGRATQFRRFVKPLMAAGYKVVAFDGPAHGQSEGKRTNLDEFEAAIRAVYAQMGEPVAVIAHSFGGGAALFSAMKGVSIKKLVMIASPSVGDEIINTYLRTINGTWATGTYFKQYVRETTGKPFDEYTAQYFVTQLKAPLDLLLVYDEEDREVPMVHADTLMKLYPSAMLIRTHGLGHTRILKDDHIIAACVTFVRNGASG